MPELRRAAVITGAAGGIGQALVRAFDGAGFDVIATDRSPLPENLHCGLFLQSDLARTVSDEAYAEEQFEQIRNYLANRGLAALVNNAAVQILGGAHTLSRDDWRQTLDVNLLAPFFWTQGLLPDLEKVNGSVVNISSIHARLTKKNFLAYATSKAALSGMTRAMAVDCRSRIRINAIEPAAIETEMLKKGFEGQIQQYNALMSAHPSDRIGTPAEVAKLAVLLCDGPGFIHGACVGIDGGISGVLHDPA